MQGCERIRKLIDAYLDGELSKLRGRRVEHHLAACAAFQRYLESSRRVQRAVEKETAAYAADPGLELLWARIEASLAEVGPREGSRAWRDRLRSAWQNTMQPLRLAPAAAAVAAVLLLIVLPHVRDVDRVRDEVVIESLGGENVTFVVSKFKETNTSIIWIVESNG
jgi:anti-sigma factor RsiW